MAVTDWWRSWFVLPIVGAVLFQSWPSPVPIWAELNVKNVMVLTAHPDDEAFFFSPTILALKEHGIPVMSLCLSTGNADGLGEVRKGELEKSLLALGIDKDMSFLVDHPKLQDNISQAWDANIIADVIGPYMLKYETSIILTFDDYGVSGHPNHLSLFHGAKHYVASLASTTPRPRLFSLTSVPLYEKYSGPLMAQLLPAAVNSSTVTFTSGPAGYLKAAKAMSQHRSQLEWYRILYTIFSRYLWINDWEEVKFSDN